MKELSKNFRMEIKSDVKNLIERLIVDWIELNRNE